MRLVHSSLILINGPEIMSKMAGESESNLRKGDKIFSLKSSSTHTQLITYLLSKTVSYYSIVSIILSVTYIAKLTIPDTFIPVVS